MRIQNVNHQKFNANYNSNKLKFRNKDFFVNIKGYGKNANWAKSIIETADTATNLIRNGTSAENVLKWISISVKKANLKTVDLNKKLNTGILRASRSGWTSSMFEDVVLITSYTQNRYKSYETRLDEVAISDKTKILPEKFSIPVILAKDDKKIIHADSKFVNSNLDMIFDLTKKLFPKYLQKDLGDDDLLVINSTISEIRWVLAHTTPWLRGSDAISNVFMRAMYKALGIKTFPTKQGVSLDMEAFCTTKEDYIKSFTTYFEEPPVIIK